MSSIKIVINKGSRKVSFTNHYSYPMNFIQGKAEHKSLVKQLNFLLKHEKGSFDPSPYDAGLIVFDVGKKTIDNRQNGGFDASNLESFPKGWKIIERDGVVTSKNFKAYKKKKEGMFKLN